jgi:hypothetical protein
MAGDIQEPGGRELLEALVSLSGLPSGLIEMELEEMLKKRGQSVMDLTLADLRQVLASHLEHLVVEDLVELDGLPELEAGLESEEVAPGRITPVLKMADR